jgi:hypothetical protein
MNRINININAGRNIAETRSVAWGRRVWDKQGMTWGRNTGAFVFAAVLIVCSLTVGCSSDKPKPASDNNPISEPQIQRPAMPATMQAESKPVPAPKKVVHKKPATVNYADKTYGVTFEYPRRYAIETGNAATEMLASNPIAMNFVQPGGVALAAVELPETGFANTDFSSAFFDVSVHKSLSADQCGEFAVPQAKASPAVSTPLEPVPAQAAPVVAASDRKQTDPAEAQTTQSAATDGAGTPASTPMTTAQVAKSDLAAAPSGQTQSEPQGSKLLIGDMELRATEAVAGEGTRQNDSKYFHVFQNGACYEFALNVTTVASEEGLTKHVDRDKVFGRLEQVLATVKISPVAAPEVKADTTADAPATAVAESPAQ